MHDTVIPLRFDLAIATVFNLNSLNTKIYQSVSVAVTLQEGTFN